LANFSDGHFAKKVALSPNLLGGLTLFCGVDKLEHVLKKFMSINMALLDESPKPPSQLISETEKTKNLNFSKIKNHLYIFKRFLIGLKLFFVKAYANSASINRTIFSSIKSFLSGSKYIPHYAIFILFLVVFACNQRDKLIAQASSAEILTVGPDVQYNVASMVDPFTDTIPDDAGAVERATVATLSSDGFINNNSTVLTAETARDATGAPLDASGLPDNTDRTVDYVVKQGDTLTGLGWLFDVKIATIKYLNDITDADSIKPGTKLKIPPKNYEVSPSLIAKKEAELRAKLAAASAKTATTVRKIVSYATGSKYNGYPYGYCTYYVATIRQVPANWGDAKSWLSSASRSGYSTGKTPAVGAIVVTSESWWGHVAFVTAVSGSMITISEMNARGWGVISQRTLSAYGGAVRGYIY
jgi:surface antigen